MATKETAIRLSPKGQEQLKAALREIGVEGDTALDRITKGAVPASRGLKAVDAAANDVRDRMEGMAQNAGILGRGLTAIGPAGLAVTAGMGVATLALGKGLDIARDAVAEFDTLAKTADKIGVATGFLQEMRFAAGSLAGMTQGALDTSLQRFNRRVAEAAQGTGEAKAALEELGVPLRDNQGRLRTTESLLDDVARGMGEMETDADRLRVAVKLFDTEGAGMVNVLKDSGDAMEETRQRARDLGIVIDERLLRSAEDMQDKLDTASQVIDVNLKTALIDLAPLLISAAEGAAWVAKGLNSVRDAIVDIESKSARGLDASLRSAREGLENDIARLERLGEKDTPFANRLRDSLEETIASRRKDIASLEDEITRRKAEKKASGTGMGEIPPASLPPGLPPPPSRTTSPRDLTGDIEKTRRETARAIEDAARLEIAIEKVSEVGGQAATAFLDKGLKFAEIQRVGEDALARATGPDGKLLPMARDYADAMEARARAQQDKAILQEGLAAEIEADKARIDADRKAVEDREKDALSRLRGIAKGGGLKGGTLTFDAARENRETARLMEERAAAALDLADIERETLDTRRLAALLTVPGKADEAALDAAEARLKIEEQRLAVLEAGEDAARSAGRFDDPERLRSVAEERERAVQALNAGREALTARRTELEQELDSLDRIADAERKIAETRALVEASADPAKMDTAALDAMEERITAERDLIAVRAAGDRAAAAAVSDEEAARLREIAEETQRLVHVERDRNEAIRERRRALDDSADAQRRLDQQAARAQEQEAKRMADLTASFAEQAIAVRDLEDALHVMISVLDRAGAFEALFKGVFNVPGASGSGGGIDGLSGGIGKMIGGAFGGAGINPFGGLRANGGRAEAGRAYQVNENTPNSELFVPSQNGGVLNVAQAQAALRNQVPAQSASAAPVMLQPVFKIITNDPATRVEIPRSRVAQGRDARMWMSKGRVNE